MDEKLTLGILGLYTVIYLVVFFIQKSQIDRQKDVITSMKSFMEIFKVDEVKKYVEMRNERILHDATKFITDSDQIKKMSDDLIKNTTKPIQEAYTEIMAQRYEELVRVVFQIVINQEPERREQFIKDLLPNNEHYLIPMLKDYENKIV
ncbi:hypothetical protein E1J38_014750 [Seonamhaeicola sediminis]|uniref:Uncharacterized protein n=1 Tax=Seonamhaeicola sediminis TaxID=2528206 RepID=A0A562Y7K7_9FLAO|nr:hypothetical protein [Seonamhaeicola sediminis]TWO30411.1 hypothetical protein E1J38_014750 [Seonamhaeicola sediminis]